MKRLSLYYSGACKVVAKEEKRREEKRREEKRREEGRKEKREARGESSSSGIRGKRGGGEGGRVERTRSKSRSVGSATPNTAGQGTTATATAATTTATQPPTAASQAASTPPTGAGRRRQDTLSPRDDRDPPPQDPSLGWSHPRSQEPPPGSPPSLGPASRPTGTRPA